jgi:hypothetical protein
MKDLACREKLNDSGSGRVGDSLRGSFGDRSMSLEKDWDSIRPERSFRAGEAGMGVLRITLLFGSAAVALALLATPLLDRSAQQQFARGYPSGLDMTSTGSIGHSTTYTVRRSVLQPSPDSVCIISAGGRHSGDC